MAEIHVQAKKHQKANTSWVWIIVLVLLAAAAAYFLTRDDNEAQENNQVTPTTTPTSFVEPVGVSFHAA